MNRITIPPPPRTIEDRLGAIEANVTVLVSIVQDIAQELGIRARVRANIERLEKQNGHDTEPCPGEHAGEMP